MRKLVALVLVVFGLSGCRIFTVLDRAEMGGAFFEPVDVEKMPDGGYLVVGCTADNTWGGVGIVVTRPDGDQERFFPGCGGPLDASPAPDGTIYFSWQADPAYTENPFFTIVALDPETGSSATVFTYDHLITAVTYAPDGRLLFGARDTTADASGVRRHRIHEVTGPTTSVAVAGTKDLGESDFAVDAVGTIFGTATAYDSGQPNKVFSVEDGTRRVIAGTGVFGFSGDGGPATAATLWSPYGVDVNAAGEVFIADYNNQRIRMIDTQGVISTVAGGGTSDQEGTLATRAELGGPLTVAVDVGRDFWIADYAANRVRHVGYESGP